MFRNLSLLILLSCALHAFAQTPAAKGPATATQPATTGVLADGTPVHLRLENTNASGGRVGDTVELEVVEDVRVSEVVVIPKGSVATAVVTNPQSKITNGKSGSIDVDFQAVALSDGKKVALRGSKERRAGSTVVSSGAGQDVSIASETDIIVYINGDTTLDLVKLRAAYAPTTEIRITSTPPNADISLDGRNVGSTPYVLHASAGDHVLVVRQAGYRPWQRNLRVGTQPLSLEVPLTKEDGLESIPRPKAAATSLGDAARAARAQKSSQPPSSNTPDASGSPQATPQN